MPLKEGIDDDVERIDLVDDFHANCPARLRPIRVLGAGVDSGHYYLPSSLARHLFSAETYKRSEKDRHRQGKIDGGIAPARQSRLFRFMQICEFSVRNGQITDWYFTHNAPRKVSA